MRAAWVALVALAACPGPGSKPEPARPGSGSDVIATPAVPIDAPEATQEERLAAIQKAMNELDEAAQGCWAAAAVVRFDIEGEIAATIDITPGAAKVSIARDTTRNPGLAACLVQVLAGYPWAPPLHGQAIQLPFKFRAPKDGQNVIDRKLVPWVGQGKLAVAVLLDEHNSGNAAASMVELAIAAGGSTGARIAERAELWYFLNAGTVEAGTARRAVAAGDMMFVPAQGARSVSASADLHAVITMVPGGAEGSARAGALPTRELGAIKSPVAGPIHLPASAAKQFCVKREAVCKPTDTTVQIFAEPATIQSKVAAASVLAMHAGGSVPEHVHTNETELLYILSGSGTMTVNGVALAVTATSVVQIPANTKHAFAASADLRAVQIYTPAGPEQRFKPKP
jgi:quercetin dioxygenase-like cupin family protein